MVIGRGFLDFFHEVRTRMVTGVEPQSLRSDGFSVLEHKIAPEVRGEWDFVHA